MRKILLQFAYIGTNYRGLQVLTASNLASRGADLDSVQGILELGLKKVLKYNNISLRTSSRTDAGVHALSSTCQFFAADDIFSVVPFSPEILCQSLNLYLEKNLTDIRIKRILQVPLDFDCRKAHSRTYQYRIALLKTNDIDNCQTLFRMSGALPITELNRAQVVPQPFDVNLVQQAARVFIGTWNFKSFSKPSHISAKEEKKLAASSKSNKKSLDEDLLFTKTIYKFSFTKTKIEEDSGYYSSISDYDKFDFYDFTIQGSGFLRRQVRRMVGILLSIGKGNTETISALNLLKSPSYNNWNSTVASAGAEGLYLKSVNYKNPIILRGSIL